ncbi:MAG: hypothetical protein AAB605_02970 [Patescibacteria group bacterium]
MTTQHVVADDVLGKISRKVWELIRRVLEGSIDPERTLALLQPALEGVPRPHDGKSTRGTYLLESRWSWDNSHREFATIEVEECDLSIQFEDLLNPSASKGDKKWVLGKLKRIFEAQIPMHGGYKMIRLYRVLSTRHFGYSPGCGLDGTLERETVDVHLILKPICEFADDGEPIPCKIDRKKSL